MRSTGHRRTALFSVVACALLWLSSLCGGGRALAQDETSSPVEAAPVEPRLPGISGRVLTDAGEPVAGAVVRIRPKGAAPGAMSIETDEQGRFSYEELDGDAFYLRVEAPGWAARTLTDVERGPHEIVLDCGRSVTGRALDRKTGRPLAGAWVRLRDHGSQFFRTGTEVATVSDDAGRYRFDHVPSGYAWVYLVADAHAEERVGPVTIPAPEKTEATDDDALFLLDDVFLGPGGRLAGRIDDARGQPVEGCRVDAVPTSSSGDAGSRGPQRTDTDEQGRFAFDGLPAGTGYLLKVRSSRFALARVGPFPIEAGTVTDDVSIRLSSGATLTVLLLDPDDNAVTEVGFHLESSDDRGLGRFSRGAYKSVREDQIEVDDEGRIRVTLLEAGRYDVYLRPVDYFEIVRDGVRLVEDEVVDLGTLHAEPGSRLAGRVADSDDRPVAGAQVTVAWRNERGHRRLQKKTDDDGAFAFGGIEETPVEVTVAARRFTSKKLDGVAPDEDDLVVTLIRPGSIRGTVRLAGGAIAPPFTVKAFAEAQPGSIEALAQVARDASGVKEIDPATGTFELRELAEGRYTVEVRAPGLAPGRRNGVEVRIDEVTDTGEIELAPGLVISGRVVSDSGETPVAGAAIRLDRTSGFPFKVNPYQPAEATALSDVDGRFEMNGLEAGRWTVSVEHTEYSPAKETVALESDRPTQEVEVRLLAGGEISGTVRDADGIPISGADVVVFQSFGAEGQRMASTGPDGTYRFPRVAAGTYMVALSRSDARSMLDLNTKTATVRDGETTVVDFDEGSTLTLSGYVRRGSDPIPHAQLMFVRAPGAGRPDIASSRSDGDGRYEVRLGEPGKYHVNVMTGTTTSMRLAGGARLEVPDEPRVTLDIVLAGSGIQGRVVDGEGNPVPAAQVVAAREGRSDGFGGVGLAETLSDGTFVIDSLEAGSYVLSVQADRFSSGRAGPVVVVAGQPTGDVEIVLRRGRAFRGRVVDPSGASVAGAIVMVAPSSTPGFGESFGGSTATSGPDGQFEFRVEEDSTVDLTAFAAGLAPARLRGWMPPDDDQPGPLIVMSPGGTARVTLVDTRGDPRAGTALFVAPVNPGPDGPPFVPTGAMSSADAAGVALLEHLAPGSYRVEVPGKAADPVTFDVREGEIADVRVVVAE